LEYYQNGKRIKAANYNAGKLLNTTDYVKNIYITADGNEIPLKEKEANDSMANSSGKKVVQVEAEFKNGKKGWQYYLERNLRIPDRLKNVLGQGAYKVVCGFFVNKTGGVEDIYVAESREWSADTEVLRIIKNSPLWVPAQEDGKPVYYHARQAVTLVIN
jgi:protein TonB